MNTTGTKAPGWYTDPVDPALIRYWDGQAWTERLRPRPAWAPPLDDEEEARHRAALLRRRRRWAQGTGTVLVGGLIVLTLLAARGNTPAIPERTVADEQFTEAANRLCAQRMPTIREQPPEPGDDEGREAPAGETARGVERTADDLGKLLVDLRALPVAEADRKAVEGWFHDWDRFVHLGHRYADAIRHAGSSTQTSIAAEAVGHSRRIWAFAKGNGMPECAFERI